MFRILSKESNIFSIPVYIIFLLIAIIGLNTLNYNTLNPLPSIVLFLGVALGYFVFGQINLTYKTHLPLFLYTFFIFAFYSNRIDLGISVSLLTNSFLLMILTSPVEHIRKKSYLLVGSTLVINYLFLPTAFPMLVFVILHIVSTSQKIPLNLIRLFLGIGIIFFAYFCIMYFLGYSSFDETYLPYQIGSLRSDFYPLYLLTPIFVMMVYAILDHFSHYNEKSPESRFKYTFLLVFMATQLISIIFYMEDNYQYLLLLAFPVSIILSRMLRFFPKYWMQETGLWLIAIVLVIFKLGRNFQF
ncbi:MAG: DUF6427 family protein [Bergeyella zoohelcum]|nr:DUF6427 family protein [Bergeyella zoohelcum]